MKIFVIGSLLFAVVYIAYNKNEYEPATTANAEGILIPRTMSGDKGKYFLLKADRNGDVIRALHKREGVDSVGYTLTQTNCESMRMMEMGYSETSTSAIKEKQTEWFDLVRGSSKSDLATFVCSRF